MKKLLMFLVSIVILTGCIIGENIAYYQIEGNAMSPTLENGQRLIIDKDYYIKNEIKRDDIVLFNIEDKEHVKRVVGLPDEYIQILNGTIYIDNEPIESEFPYEDVWIWDLQEEGIQLKSDEYFIIGDSNNSLDSRSIGPVDKEDILGKVIFIK